jgi:hypothetical protein
VAGSSPDRAFNDCWRAARGGPESPTQTGLAAATGDPNALDALKTYGDRYLVVDKVDAQYADTATLDRLLKPVSVDDAGPVYDISQR